MTNNQYREFSRQIKALAVMCSLAVTMSVGHAQQPGALAPVVGATVAGVPLTQYARPDDSTSGVTQATPANRAMTCSAGYVLSGGSCVTLASMIPPAPNCAYGQTWTGGACVSISGFSPPPINCPSGQVLSGSVCVALPVAAAPTCAAQPDTTQYVPCSAGQTGVITQTRSGSCNISTGYVWAMSSWNTQSSTCVSAPPAPVVVAPPPPPPATCSVLPTLAWGAGCSGPASPSGTLASGATTSATSNVANWPGSTTYACSNGALTQTAGSCSFNQPPAPPVVVPPQNCASQTVTWQMCSAVAVAVVHGANANVYDSATWEQWQPGGASGGSATFQCNNGTFIQLGMGICSMFYGW